MVDYEDLTHGDSNHRDDRPVPRLLGFRGLVGPYLTASGIRAGGGDLSQLGEELFPEDPFNC